MIIRKTPLIAALSLWRTVRTEVAPEITSISEGYNLIAKLPCIGCPFLYQDASDRADDPWKTRDDENALLLNISLPFTTPHLSINTAHLPPNPKFLPRIYAPQVLLDTSTADITNSIESNQLETPGAASFGISYRYSLTHIRDTHALLFTFDVFEAFNDAVNPYLTAKLDNEKQKVLEVVLLRRPLMSAGDGAGYEIVRAKLVPRISVEKGKGREIGKETWYTMRFHDWDSHGEKGTTGHLISTTSQSFEEYIMSGVWGLFIFIMAIIGLFVVICLFCIFGCGLGKDEYESAQQGKKRSSGKGGRNDVEKGKGRFLSAEELGLRSGGKVVGVGKSD